MQKVSHCSESEGDGDIASLVRLSTGVPVWQVAEEQRLTVPLLRMSLSVAVLWRTTAAMKQYAYNLIL